MPTRDKRSRTWQYFDISNENKKMAVCLLCQMQISRGGVGKKAGTSAMSNHLKSKHPDKSNEICKTKSPTLFLPSPAADPLPGPSSSLTSTQKLLSLSESFEQKILQDVNGTKAKKYHYLITEMIALDNEPLSVVERVGFSRLMKQAVPHYEVPSRTYITQKILPDVYNRIHAKIATHLSTALAISVTSDVWMCIHNNATFLSFTAHWLSTEFQLEHAFLGIKPFPRSHTGENIAKELDTIAARWNIHQSKIHLLIHDSDANMVNDVRMAEYDSARCFIHSLQRVVTESLKVQHEVVEMIAAGRHLVMHFNHSSLAQDKLMELQKELYLPQHQLVQDINTRWNSTYYMKERLLEQKQAISVYVADHDTLNLNNLTAQQWDLMEQCIKVLKPFEEITKMTSSGLSCISEVIPHVAALKKYLDKNEIAQISPDLPYMRTSLRAEIERCFSILEQDQNYLIATFLDPRFKTNYLGAVEAERARQIILSEYLKKSCDDSPTSERDSPSSSPVKSRRIDEAGSTVTREARDTFWNCFDEIANENSGQCQDQEKSAIANEIEYYLKTVCLDRSSDPYLWWSVNAKQYPNLTKFARIYLSAPCSSVYSERLFSEPGLVYENKRNRLLATNTENIVFIHHNLPLVNFEY